MLFALTIVGILVLYVGWMILQDVRQKRPGIDVAWREMARKLHGTYDPADYTIRFPVMGRSAVIRLYYADHEGPSGVCIEVDMRGCSPGALVIVPETVGNRISRIFGERDVLIGDENFDRDFWVTANPSDLARRVFSPEKRQRLMDLVWKASRHLGPRIELQRQKFRLRVYSHLIRPDSILYLAEAVVELVAAIIGAEGSVEVLWTEVTTRSGGQCQICGYVMKKNLVTCDRCRTSHHEECWNYAGGCSMYGCGSTTHSPEPEERCES